MNQAQRARKYGWIVSRAMSGEPVPIEGSRRDFDEILDFLMEVDGCGLAIQCDTAARMIWVTRTDG